MNISTAKTRPRLSYRVTPGDPHMSVAASGDGDAKNDVGHRLCGEAADVRLEVVGERGGEHESEVAHVGGGVSVEDFGHLLHRVVRSEHRRVHLLQHHGQLAEQRLVANRRVRGVRRDDGADVPQREVHGVVVLEHLVSRRGVRG